MLYANPFVVTNPLGGLVRHNGAQLAALTHSHRTTVRRITTIGSNLNPLLTIPFCAGPNFPEFLLPFRKPKRIRTAFSPNQLLKLEQAFEKNQYVVGQERKELAKTLNLSETQVLLHTY